MGVVELQKVIVGEEAPKQFVNEETAEDLQPHDWLRLFVWVRRKRTMKFSVLKKSSFLRYLHLQSKKREGDGKIFPEFLTQIFWETEVDEEKEERIYF